MNKKKSMRELEQYPDSKFEKSFSGAKGFAHYFSKLDVEGIRKVLSHDPERYYLELIERVFNSLKSKGISLLEVHSGVCSGCKKGCSGFTFIDVKSGYYIDMIVEHNERKITFVDECFGLQNSNKHLNKKQAGIMDPLASCNYRCK